MTLNLSVTDDRYGRLMRRVAAIAERLDKSAPFEAVMLALQHIHDGVGLRLPRKGGDPLQVDSLTIGGVPRKQLMGQLVAKRGHIDRHTMFLASRTNLFERPTTVMLAYLTPADLGFKERPTTAQLFNERYLAEWSLKNLEGYILQPNPPEVGLWKAIRSHEARRTTCYIAMEPTEGKFFAFGTNDEAEPWFMAVCDKDGEGGTPWKSSDLICYRLRAAR